VSETIESMSLIPVLQWYQVLASYL